MGLVGEVYVPEDVQETLEPMKYACVGHSGLTMLFKDKIMAELNES